MQSQPIPGDDDRKIRTTGQNIHSIESDSIMRRPFQITPEELKVKGDNTTRSIQHKKSDTGEVGPVNHVGVTNNLYKERSEVLKRDGILVQIHWKNSNARFLHPLMPVIYTEQVANKVIQRRGILHHMRVMTDNTHQTEQTVLTIFLQNKTTPDSISVGSTLVNKLL